MQNLDLARIDKAEFRRLAKHPKLPDYSRQQEWWADQARSRLGVLMHSKLLKCWPLVILASNRKPTSIIPGQSTVFVVDMGVSDTREEAVIKLQKLLTKPHYL